MVFYSSSENYLEQFTKENEQNREAHSTATWPHVVVSASMVFCLMSQMALQAAANLDELARSTCCDPRGPLGGGALRPET